VGGQGCYSRTLGGGSSPLSLRLSVGRKRRPGRGIKRGHPLSVKESGDRSDYLALNLVLTIIVLDPRPMATNSPTIDGLYALVTWHKCKSRGISVGHVVTSAPTM
jgi:hypothetical protein